MSTFKLGASINLYMSSFFNFKFQDAFSWNLNFKKSQPICAYKRYAYKREWILWTKNVESISANLHKIHTISFRTNYIWIYVSYTQFFPYHILIIPSIPFKGGVPNPCDTGRQFICGRQSFHLSISD